MLILQRRPGESLRIGDGIEVSVLAVDGGRVRLAITAPADVTILRSELIQAEETNKESVMPDTVPAELLTMLGESAPETGVPCKPLTPPRDLKPGAGSKELSV